MIPFSFLQTDDGDVDLRFIFTPDLPSYVAQALRTNLSFFLGEWFLDTRQGVPLFQRILGVRYDANLVSQVFRKAALLTPGVAAVPTLISAFDRRSRTLSLPTFRATLRDGSTLTQDDLAKPFIVTLATPEANP